MAKIGKIQAMKRKSNTKLNQSKLVDVIKRKLLIILGLMVVALIVVQIIILAAVGTAGPRITSLQNQVDETSLDNELKLAKINELQSIDEVKSCASDELGMAPGRVETIEVLGNEPEVQAAMHH